MCESTERNQKLLYLKKHCSRFQSFINRKETDVNRILIIDSSRASWTRCGFLSDGCRSCFQSGDKVKTNCPLNQSVRLNSLHSLVENEAMFPQPASTDRVLFSKVIQITVFTCFGSDGSLQQLDCSFLVVPPGLLQRRAPPPGAKTELHHTPPLRW